MLASYSPLFKLDSNRLWAGYCKTGSHEFWLEHAMCVLACQYACLGVCPCGQHAPKSLDSFSLDSNALLTRHCRAASREVWLEQAKLCLPANILGLGCALLACTLPLFSLDSDALWALPFPVLYVVHLFLQ